MAMPPEDLVHRGYDFAIVDEVDSILVDEARTPLIISGRVSDGEVVDFARSSRVCDATSVTRSTREDGHHHGSRGSPGRGGSRCREYV